MNPEEVKEYLVDFQKRKIPELIKRDLRIEESKKIKSIIGPRRAGKTYFMYQKINEILQSTKKESTIYLNFEDPRLIGINFKDVRDIIKLHWQLYPLSIKQKLHIFIDEPQNIENWEIAVRALYDEGFDIYLTGSSSKLLSKEIATSLRGRTLSYILLPFSFKEFLKIKNIVFNLSRLGSRDKANLLSLLDEHIEFGGFPEVILEKNKENKIKTIVEYLDLIVYKDIIERYNIKNTQLIRWLIKTMITSFSNELSIHNIFLTLKSKGIKVSKNTLYSYFSMLEDSIFLHPLLKFNYSVRKSEFSINKIYLSDVGFTKTVEISRNKGRKMENMVFLELMRRKKAITQISYFKNQQKEEVDFVIKEKKIKQLIQACYDINDYDTRKREVKVLLKASKELKCNNLLIITSDKEGEETKDKKKIKYIPLWKWLLKQV